MPDRYIISLPDQTDTGQWEVADTHEGCEPFTVAIFSSEYDDAAAWAHEFANFRNAEDQRSRGGFAELRARQLKQAPITLTRCHPVVLTVDQWLTVSALLGAMSDSGPPEIGAALVGIPDAIAAQLPEAKA